MRRRHTMLKIQNYLQSNSLESLKEKYFIDFKRHSKYPNLILFKYNQIESDFNEEIVRESRGIILDEKDNWNIVSISYFKFFNYGEQLAANIDWESSKCYEKLDGSLIVLYWYDNQWLIQSSGSPDASGNVDIYDFTFNELFWRVWKELEYRLPDESWKNYCFSFELCTPYNKIVVQHNKNRIVLHGTRNRIILKESNVDQYTIDESGWNWEIVKSYPLNTLESVIESAKQLNPINNEGFVIVDKDFNRIKMKSPQYVMLHHLKEGMSKDKLLTIIKTNEYEEFLVYFPEYKEIYNKLKEKYYILIDSLEKHWNLIKNIETRKNFAMEAKKCEFADCMFKLKDKKEESVKSWILNCRNEHLLQRIGD
jgi:hypothetical protein